MVQSQSAKSTTPAFSRPPRSLQPTGDLLHPQNHVLIREPLQHLYRLVKVERAIRRRTSESGEESFFLPDRLVALGAIVVQLFLVNLRGSSSLLYSEARTHAKELFSESGVGVVYEWELLRSDESGGCQVRPDRMGCQLLL